MSDPSLASAAASETVQPAPAMPQFFHRVVGVNPATHGHLRLDRSVGYGFTRGAQSVPIGLGEFDVVAQHYPIVFASGPAPAPVALLGLGDGNNLFLMPDNTWRKDSYIPAYVRAYPFIFVEDANTKAVYVGMEADAECLNQPGGVPLFEDGKPTQALNETISFCTAFRDNLVAAGAFARALDAAGLLEEEEANVTFAAGGATRIRGFKILKPERLDQVSDETFLEWRRRGWLGPLYAQLHSAGRWARLIELASAPK